jgi:hypothetical protein
MVNKLLRLLPRRWTIQYREVGWTMETRRGTRKDSAHSFADVIPFRGKSDVRTDLKDFLDHIGSPSTVAPTARRANPRKVDRAQDPVRHNEMFPPGPKRAPMVAMVFLLALSMAAGGWALFGRYFGGEQGALDTRASELTTHAFRPGSQLACLLGYAGDAVESSCENALFSSPEVTAGAVSYVAAQLSLLADGDNYLRRSIPSYGQALTSLRHAVEIDRFGFVAHVLSLRDGCTADQCRFFGLLQDTRRVRANLSEHTYESYVARHSARWQTAVTMPSASLSAATMATQPSGGSDVNRTSLAKLKFPSSASFPAVNIMDPEPSPAPSRKR